MRDVPKTQVAGYVHDAGLLPALINAAAAGQPWSIAAQAFLDVIFNPSLHAIDLDDAQYQSGIAALVAVGVIHQADADAIDAMYVRRAPFSLVSAVLSGSDWLVTVADRNGVQETSQYSGWLTYSAVINQAITERNRAESGG